MKPIRLAIVDDSPFIRSALVKLLQDTRLSVVGVAQTGEELLANLDAWKPDIITLDIHMPGIGGMRTLDHIMARRPTPVIMMSTHSGAGAPLTVEALGRGAADFIDKEEFSLVDFQRLRVVLLEKATALTARSDAAAKNKVRRPEPAEVHAAARPTPSSGGVATASSPDFDIVVLGASTGGPRAIEQVLGDMAVPGVPVAVVQHMPGTITKAFAERLNRTLPMEVREAVDGEPMKPGTAYVAPGGLHMRLEGAPDAPRVSLSMSPAGTLHRPSVDVLFNSLARLAPRRSLVVLMTGMGNDGAQGMTSLRASGAYTIAQDEESCVVYGMPRAAVEMGGATEVLPLGSIGPRVRSLLEGS